MIQIHMDLDVIYNTGSIYGSMFSLFILSCDICFPLFIVYFLVYLMSLLLDDIVSGILAIACIKFFTYNPA